MGASAWLRLAPRQPSASEAVVTARRGLVSGRLTALPGPGRRGSRPDLQLSGAPGTMETPTHGRISLVSTKTEHFCKSPPSPFSPTPTHYGVQLCAGGGEKAGARDPGLAAAQPLELGCPGASETTAWLLEVPSSQHSGHGGGALFMCPQSLPSSSGFFLHRNYLFLFQKLYSSLFAKKKKQAKPQCRKGKLLPCSAMSVYPRFFLFYYKWDQIGFPAVAQRGQVSSWERWDTGSIPGPTQLC